MRYGLDAASPPVNMGELSDLRNRGWEWFAGYIGGNAARVWALEDWRRVARANFDLLPIWVGHLADDPGYEQGIEEGNGAVFALQQLGLSGIVALDIENGLKHPEYCRGFVDAAHAGLVDVAVYGTPGSIGMGVDFDAWWLAFWPGTPMPLQDAPPDWSYWQYAAGGVVDFNVARDDCQFAGSSF